jgi:hypothetical protein
VIHVTRHYSGWLHAGLLIVGLKAAEVAETLPDDGRVAPPAYRAIFLAEFDLPSGARAFLQYGMT